ncbi:hypothetical protein RND81_11G017200 [Saponaria officinalis]|uniref:Uncharacterized protein n=1 Tax=Saponaria officinalis TaxID=3572 RepID=A0AAW1HH02_SAPOF
MITNATHFYPPFRQGQEFHYCLDLTLSFLLNLYMFSDTFVPFFSFFYSNNLVGCSVNNLRNSHSKIDQKLGAKMRLYDRGAAFCEKMRVSKMSKKLNIRNYIDCSLAKRRLPILLNPRESYISV